MSDRGFDEVMIVNPFDPRSNPQHSTFMRFHEAPEMGYYGEPPEMGYYGYYAEPPPELGYYAQPSGMGYYGEPPELGYYAQVPQPYGYYGEPPEMGGYAEPPEMGYAEPVEYYAEETPMSGYGYAQMPEMVGYSEYEPLAEDYPGMSCYGEPDISGYVREVRRPPYNPGCPIPTNVAGYSESAPLEGYVRPAPTSPSCDNLTPPPGGSSPVPDTFRPLW